MSSQTFEFRECTNPECRFRFPAPIGLDSVTKCPRCRKPTQSAKLLDVSPENNTIPYPPVQQNLDVLFDNLRSTWNIGSMLRTAEGAGIRRAYLCGTTSPPDHPKVARTSLGAENNLEWNWYPNAPELGKDLIHQGKRLWALEATPDALPISQAILSDQDKPTVLIVGNEIVGIDPDLLSLCESCYAIPMHGIKRSLNAAVAFGIAVYAIQEFSRLKFSTG
jgi:23S rRNA (guanosine2251-2'-O)-methyltransferase